MRSDESDLLAALHEGMFDQPLWHGFLERLRTRTRARYASLVFVPIDGDGLVELTAGPPPEPGSLLREKFGCHPPAYLQMREGRVYALEELPESGNPAQLVWRKEFLGPMGVRELRSVRVTETSGVDAWLSCCGGREIGPATGAMLTSLAPHLRIALRNFVALERERFRSSVTTEAFGRLNFGWLTLDAQCRIIDMTPHVEQLLQRTTVLRRGRYDRLTPASPAVDRKLTALVKTYAEGREARPRALNLSRDPWMDLLVSPIQSHPVSARSQPVAVAYLGGDRWSHADRCEQLVEMFALLPSEARLAWGLARGLSIREVAEELNLTVETARNYSKKVYAKTGARGQAELVRNILTSVLAIA
ncbi:MAG: helix-turn-helix transcriptional regulator [Sphingomonadaceae bacterium]